MSSRPSGWGRAVGHAFLGGIVGALTSGFLSFAVIALLITMNRPGMWGLVYPILLMIALFFGGVGGAIAPLVVPARNGGTECGGGRAVFWGVVGAAICVLACGGIFVGMGRNPAIVLAGIPYLALCGSIPAIVAWADRAEPDRRTSRKGCLVVLPLSPLLIGVAILKYDPGSVRPPRVAAPSAPGATAAPAPTHLELQTKSQSDAANDAATAPTYRIEKMPDNRFVNGGRLLCCLALPIVFGAYGAFLGGRAVRVFLEREGGDGQKPSSGLEGPATSGDE